MIPKSFKDTLPGSLYDEIDDAGQALVDFIDEQNNFTQSSIIDLLSIKYPEKIESILIPYLDYYLQADITNTDTEKQKRQKLSTAIERHKLRCTFKYDVKKRIDAITLKSSSIAPIGYFFSNTDSIICDGVNFLTTRYSSIGTDGVNIFGMDIPSLFGAGIYPGKIPIDLGYTEAEILAMSPSFLANLLDTIELNIITSAPAYMIIALGYIDSLSEFIILKEI